ncbi:hypothetical protein ACFXTO_010535 [Malus domestica]
MSVASESYHQAEKAKETVKTVVHQVPSIITYGSALLLGKIGFRLLGAAYVSMVLLLSALFGIWLVKHWVEEPVFVRERLLFDYTEPHPITVFAFGSADDIYQDKSAYSRKHVGGCMQQSSCSLQSKDRSFSFRQWSSKSSTDQPKKQS